MKTHVDMTDETFELLILALQNGQSTKKFLISQNIDYFQLYNYLDCVKEIREIDELSKSGKLSENDRLVKMSEIEAIKSLRCRMFSRAKQLQADTFADQIIDIADDQPKVLFDPMGKPYFNNAQVQQNKLAIEARQWLMKCRAPRKYGVIVDDDNNKQEHVIRIGFDLSGAKPPEPTDNTSHTQDDSINNM